MNRKLFVLCIVAVALVMNFAAAQIAGTKHNLASSSANTIESTTLDDICAFCHTPHNGLATNGPLWNKATPAGPYTLYTTTIGGNFPSGLGASSMACLSCHDGAAALNNLVNSPGPGAGSDPTMTGGTLLDADNSLSTNSYANVTTNLTDDHPVGIVYDITAPVAASLLPTSTSIAGWLGGATTIQGLLRGATYKVECGTCHDPHNNSNTLFLRRSNAASAMCLTCHNK